MRQELADETAVIFVLDPSEEFGAELLYCFRAVEWQLLILCAAAKVTGHTLRLKYGFNLSVEIYPRIRNSTPTPAGLPVCGPRLAHFGR